MRGRWLLLAALVSCLAWAKKNPLPVGYESEVIAKVFSTWKDGPVQIQEHWQKTAKETPKNSIFSEDFQHDEFAIENHARSKRSSFIEAVAPNVRAPLLSTRFCNIPGYTGEFCQYPICMETNRRVVDKPDVFGEGVIVDAAYMGDNCTLQYITVIDDTLTNIIITLTADTDIYPSWDLVDANGKHYFFDFMVQRGPGILSGMYSTLPPQTYYITATPDVPNAPCRLEIKGRTSLTVEAGFITGEGWATERSDYPTLGASYQYTLNTVVAHGFNLRSPGQLAVVTMIGGSNAVSRPQPMRTRYGCGYEYYFESFFCTDLGDYLWMIEGVTWMGNPFRRVGIFSCLYNTNRPTPAPTGTTPVPTSPANCSNGGWLVQNPDGSAFCVCQGLWQGATCNQLVCMNGGYDTGGTRCTCLVGFQGTHCEDVVCLDRGRDQFYVDEPNLVFVVRVRQQMQDVLDQVMSAVTNIVNQIQVYDANYVKKFGVVFYNNGKQIFSASYSSFGAFQLAWTRWATDVTDQSGNCTDNEFTFLAAALQSLPVSPKSKVYVITDSMPQDYGDVLDTVFQLDSYFRVPIYFLYVEASPGQGCVPDVHDPGFRAMDDITQRTEGLAFYVTNRTSVNQLLYNHLRYTFYRTQLILLNDLDVCTYQPVYQTLAIDSKLDQLVVVGRGNQLDFEITSDTGIVNPIKTYSGNDITIWLASGIVMGNYRVSFPSAPSSSCSFRIYQQAFTSTGSAYQFELFWKLTDLLNSDGYYQQPVAGVPLGIGVHLNQFPANIPPQFVQAELLITAQRGQQQVEIYSSNGIWRDGCDYNFYFPPFTCRNEGELLRFQFFARDGLGFPIQRAGNMYCTGYHPTQSPPGGCQNGGVINPADNSTCFCPPGYEGTLCEKLVCWNGGTPLSLGFCQCPPGFLGTHCETISCIAEGPAPQIFTKYVDMVFAVEMTTTGHAQMVFLNKMFPELLRDIVSHHEEWIRNFVLIGYNSTWGGTLATASSLNPASVLTALNNTVYNLNGLDNSTETCSATVQVWHAMAQAVIQRSIRPGSYINLFLASKPDQSNTREIIAMYSEVRQMKILVTANIAYTDANGGTYVCNNTRSNYELIHDLCLYSNGESYTMRQPYVEGFVRTIPMKFMQGVLAHRRYDDCTGTVYVSVPVDAYAQSLLIAVNGYNASVQLFNGYNKLQQAPNFQAITNANDPVSGWNFFTQRASCDPDWDPVGDYCIKFSLALNDYDSAMAICHNGGGMLVDDLSQDKHDYLIREGASASFWFGLNNRNNTGWQWDREDGRPPVPYDQNGTNFWPGGNVPNDQGKLCAYFDSSKQTNNWIAESCNVRKTFICQKHIYDWNYMPNRIDDDDMPAGKYYLAITTQLPPTDGSTNLGRGCFAEVRVQSHLQVYGGFTEDIHNDYPNMDPVTKSTQNRLISFVDSAASFQQRTPVLTHGLIFNAYNETMWDAVTYQPRAICSLNWISQPFYCPDSDNSDNLFSIYHLGEDEYGHTFQRIVNAHCQSPSVTCGNGGLRYNGTCVCTEYWQGSTCSIPICVNGGVLDRTNTRCLCPDGFVGAACEYQACTNPQNFTFDTSGASLTIVLEVTQNNRNNANGFLAGLRAVIDTLPSDWFSNYILVTFNSNGPVSSKDFTTTATLLTAITSEINNGNDGGSCNMPLFGAVSSALTNPALRMGGHLFVVSSSVPSDSASRQATIQLINGATPKIHNFYSSSSACWNNIEIPDSDDAFHFQRFAYATDGNNFFTTADQIQKAITVYLPTIGGLTNTLAHPTYFNNFTCDTPQDWWIQVDNNSTDIYITLSNDVASIVITDPRGNQISTDVLYSFNSQKYYHIEKNEAGIYLFRAVGPGLCYANIQATGGVQAWNGFALTSAADPTGSHTDDTNLFATAGVPNIAVFHVFNGNQDPRRLSGVLTYMVMWDPITLKTVYGELYPRANCHFEYYSDPFNCTAYEGFYMTIHGYDELGMTFVRQIAAWCLPAVTPTGSTPMTTTTTTANTGPPISTTAMPTTTSDSLAGRNVDIVLLLDTSSTAQPYFDDYIQFVKTFFTAFTVSQARTRIGIVTVPGDDFATFPVVQLGGIDNTAQLFQNLNDIKNNYNDFPDQGQYAGAALDVVRQEYTTLSNGYRTQINNHWIIYLTSAANITDLNDAVTNANFLKSGKYYSIAGIAYGTGAMDKAALQKITGGSSCSFSTDNQNSLMTTIARNIQQQIFDNDGTFCMAS